MPLVKRGVGLADHAAQLAAAFTTGPRTRSPEWLAGRVGDAIPSISTRNLSAGEIRAGSQFPTLNSWRLMLGDSDLGGQPPRGACYLQAASYCQMDSMDARTLFGLFAVTAMLFCYGLEGRSHQSSCLFGLIGGGVHP
jgi:hypothetical protein